MQVPVKPENEETRLNTLHSLNILDTPNEDRFDRLTRLARRLFNVPIALVSLIDEDRQWFKSRDGVALTETHRDISFCGHAILGDGLFLIPDTHKDERFIDNPLVINEPNIRFYAGLPLRYLDGSKLGTLCIMSSETKELSDEDIRLFKDLGEMAERELAALQLATQDELTKIGNRRGFATLAQNNLYFCARQNIPVSLVYFDLDEFKLINDQFGHAEGDKALKSFASIMKQTFRDADVLARLGGDEFVVLLSDTNFELASSIIARFKNEISDYNQRAQRGYDIKFCEGIVSKDNVQNTSIDSLLKQADELMYQMKKQKKSSAKSA